MIIIVFAVAALLIISLIIILLSLGKTFKIKFEFLHNTARLYHLLPLILLIIGGIIILLVALIYQSNSFKTLILEISPSNGLGQFGDFFNGILTPFLTIVTIVFLYRAFKEQFKANELFYNFEIEKSFKEDIEWLRFNNEDIIKLENTFKAFNSDKEIKDYLEDENTILLRKSIYYISMFKKLLKKIEIQIDDTKFNNNESFINVKEDVVEILIIYYLPSLKQVFRDLNNYFINQDLPHIIDLKGLNIKYLKEFSILYRIVKQYDSDEKLFINQLSQFENRLKKAQNGQN